MNTWSWRRAASWLAACTAFAVACTDLNPVTSPPARMGPRPSGPAFLTSDGETTWDFVALAGGDGPQGASHTYTIEGAGSVVAWASTEDPPAEPYAKGFEDPPGSEERGLGICGHFAANNDCVNPPVTDGEIGDHWPDGSIPSLYLDFTGLVAGSEVTSVTLSSLQDTEGWSVSMSSDGTTYTLLSSGTGSSATLTTYTIAVPAGTKYLRFDVGPGSAGNNYLVASATTTGPPPSEATPCPAGSFTYSMSANGDLVIKYDQFPAPNDNSYGVNAVGWGSHGHKFNDLVGSDHAGFQLTDGGGTVRLSFNVDYLTASAAAPSGYASLGVTGGDGKMLVGTSDGISATTSLANNLNNINIPGLFSPTHEQQFGSVNVLMDSPPTDPQHETYDNSDPTLQGWDFHNTYFVTISAAKLAAIGYDPATWSVEPNDSQLHNSPAKACPVGSGTDGCPFAVLKVEVKDRQVKVTIRNDGATDAYLTDIMLHWPSDVNGKLTRVKRDGDVLYDNPDIDGGTAHLTTADMPSDPNKRKWGHTSSHVLTFEFERNADKTLSDYDGTASFADCVLALFGP